MDDREVSAIEDKLPSLGLPYNGKIPGGVVRVSSTTVDEETMLATIGPNSTTQAIDTLFQRCVHGLNGVTPNELLTGDRSYLMMAIRVASFGSSHSYQMKCPACGNKFIHNTTLPDDLQVFYLDPETYSDVFTVELPVSKTKVSLKLLRGQDDRDIEAYKAVVYNDPAENDGLGDPVTRYTMVKHIVQVEFPGGETIKWSQNPADLRKLLTFYRRLSSRDNMVIRDALSEMDCGVNMTLTYQCPSMACQEQFKAQMPLNAQFFRPGGNRRISYL